MKREKRITKRERKANDPHHRPGAQAAARHEHIHCVACGRHIDAGEFDERPPSATWIRCDHGSTFPACIGCMNDAQARVDEHDRTGQPVKTANAWH
jgi:hypothetical protein